MRTKIFYKIITFLLFLSHVVTSSKILFYIGGTSTYSHRSSVQPLADRLAEKGHQVTVMAPMSVTNQYPTVIDIRPQTLRDTYDQFLSHFGAAYLRQRMEKRIFSKEAMDHLKWFFDLSQSSCASLLIDNPKFDSWLNKNRKEFDLLIIDSAVNECAFGLAHFFAAKTIIYSSMSVVWPWHVGFFQLPPELSWLPGLVRISEGGGDGDDLSFLDRLGNALVIWAMTMFYEHYHLRQIDQIFLRTGLGDQNWPSVSILMRKTGLIFLNQHYSDQYARPLPPFVIPVGGMHVDFGVNGTLPKKIENFIMNERKGADFIFMSLGTLVKVSALPNQFVQQVLKVIGRSRLTFLWKWEEEVPPNAPKNVFFDPWFDQQQVLTHPKIRGFITQGGQVSIQQGICHGVPLIVIPMAAEQDFNADRMKRMGHAISLDMAEFSEVKFEKAIQTLVTDKRYAVKALQMSHACKDKMVTSLETAVWHTEFVLRSDETTLNLMKPKSVHQPMWTYWCLDIWIFVFASFLLMSLGFGAFLWLILYKIIFKICFSVPNKISSRKAKKS